VNGFRYFLIESQLASVEACEKLKDQLEHDGAKNIKVYVGSYRPIDSARSTIERKGGSKLLCSHTSPNDLLVWLKARNRQAWKAPLVIYADVLVPQSETQSLPDYQTAMREISAIEHDSEGLLRFGHAWPVVKELSEIEKGLPYTNSPIESDTRRERLLGILWDGHADTAREIGAPKPRNNVDVKIDQVQNTMREIVTKITNPKEKRHARRAEKDKKEMERVLRLPLSEHTQRCLSYLTETESKVFALRWGHSWTIARIARAMDRDRKTIKETLDRANAKNARTYPVAKTAKTIAAHEEARNNENEMIAQIDKEKQANTTPHVVQRVKPQSS
jgi:sigma-70-like protein